MSSAMTTVPDAGTTIPFGQRLSRSVRFKELFAEGMQLVEEAAGYLDGKGRSDAKLLPLKFAGAYSAESMRLTTRLMQIASWLLIRRAVIDGEMLADDAERERNKFRMSNQNAASSPIVLAHLPPDLQALTARSLRLQTRIMHLDSMVNAPDPAMASRGIDQQFALLASAYATSGRTRG